MARPIRSSVLFALCMLLFLACPSVAPAREPAPRLKETWTNMEGEWLFRVDPEQVGEREGWALPGFDDSDWGTIEVPGRWEEKGSDYDGVAWHRRWFSVPESWRGEDLELSLGKVDDEDQTFYNGSMVGETGPGLDVPSLAHRCYTIPAALVRAGEDNLLAVRVRDGGGPGGIVGPTLYLLPKKGAETISPFSKTDASLDERLLNPPAEARILKIEHMLPDSPDKQDARLRQFLAQGFGGMVTNLSFTDYMEKEDKWEAFVRAVHEAKRLGMALWLYDERGYPSGTAGGITMRDHPEWEACGLLIAHAESEGGPVTLELPPGDLVQAVAFPVSGGQIVLDASTDLVAFVKDGALSWNAPSGHWRVMAITESSLYEGTHAAVSLAYKDPYINLLMPEPTARFIEVTHDQYAKRLGDDLGEWFIATFTDEPSLMSMFMRRQPYAVIPWAPRLSATFRERRGYPLEPVLAALAAEAGPRGKRVRYDYWFTVGELVSEHFFGQIQSWCREHGTLSGGHLLLEEALLTHVPLYGDFFRCARRLDAPSIDCLTSIPEEVPWFSARLISSAAELEGRAVTMCETSDHGQRYRAPGDERAVRRVTEDEIRGTCNRLILNGITAITSYYSFDGLSTEQLVRLNEWVGRCCTMLSGGHQVADIALVYPIESVWTHFEPSRNWTEDCPVAARRIERTYRAAADQLFTEGRDFTYVDAQALVDSEVQGGVLVHGDLSWQVLVMPRVDTLPMSAWERVATFWRAGGAVVALGALPANSETDFPSAQVQRLAEEIFGTSEDAHVHTNDAGGAGVFLPTGSEALLPIALDALLERDVSTSEKWGPLRVTHRRIDGREIYFVINDSREDWCGTLSFATDGMGDVCDPARGVMERVDSNVPIQVKLSPFGARLFRFEKARARKRLPVEAGVLTGLRFSLLPLVEPGAGHGEFVRGSLTGVEGSGEVVWRAEATVTKGDVDVFLFAVFDYAVAVDLSGVTGVSVTTTVPDGQETATPLRLILHDANGVESIANTDRPMNLPGRVRTFVPISSFQQAGWNKPGSGALDLSAIAALKIGWGGYFGVEGERVEFTFSPP
ncbi:MAG: hypothetical protein GWP08_17515, partial [Nitrospiraceae bacterium]|nr:hypothetical protein [Nitrospiraceae bacterium]